MDLNGTVVLDKNLLILVQELEVEAVLSRDERHISRYCNLTPISAFFIHIVVLVLCIDRDFPHKCR